MHSKKDRRAAIEPPKVPTTAKIGYAEAIGRGLGPNRSLSLGAAKKRSLSFLIFGDRILESYSRIKVEVRSQSLFGSELSITLQG